MNNNQMTDLHLAKNISSNDLPVVVTQDNVGAITKALPIHVSSVLKALTKIKVGSLTATLPNGSRYRVEADTSGPDGDVTLYNWNLPKRALVSGSIGVAESYMDRDWDSSDVTTFLELFISNYELGEEMTSPNFIQIAIG